MNDIKHLYWRAGFGLSPEEWRQRRSWTRKKAVDELFTAAAKATPLPLPEQPSVDPRSVDRAELAELQKEERRRVVDQNLAWIGRMASPEEPALLERMCLFWHGHFACRTLQSRLAVGQLNLLREHGLGKFRDLVLGIARDPSMIRYLNNQQNRKEKPNENFARELMELFTIGRGHYEERDIKEAARAFTGWSSTLEGEFVFRRFQHDYGRKTFFGKDGYFDGTDIIDLILERRETARFLVAKIYRFFVDEEVDEEITAELANQFYQSDYDIGRLMRTIFESDWFYQPKHIGARIKGPVEMLAGLIRALDLQLEPQEALLPVQRALGQTLFNPPNVAGWPGGKSWIDNATLTLRLNIPMAIYRSAELEFRPKTELEDQAPPKKLGKLAGVARLEPLFAILKGKSQQELLEELQRYLLPTTPAVSLEPLVRNLRADNWEDEVKKAVFSILSLPEYQLC